METVISSQASALQKFAPTGAIELDSVATGSQTIPDLPPSDQLNLITNHWWWYPIVWVLIGLYLLLRKRGK